MNLKNLTNATALNWLTRITIAGLVVCSHGRTCAQETETKYPRMAPIQDYLMDRSAEIELAKSAAPASISGGAEVMVLTLHGYETAVKGTNGFVCFVGHSWLAETDDPDFWNPKVRSPICLNAAAAQSQEPILIKRTEWILSGASKDQLLLDLKAAFEKKELVEPSPGSMCFMLSRQGHLNDRAGHWHPHLMFFLPLTGPEDWGANAPGSPVIAARDVPDRTTIFMVPVAQWSDGTAAPPM
jgi:hypothetical protein